MLSLMMQQFPRWKLELPNHLMLKSFLPISLIYLETQPLRAQIKATIATPRQRVIKFPVYCFDVETDKYNVMVGYLGRAFDRLSELEIIEENGDVVTWQDLTTGEFRQAVIEQINFTRLTPPDRGFSGYGGVVEITIRTV
jgi:hypothetical protein